MAKFIWLSSYPKSGNTWLRFMIAALVRGKLDGSGDVVQQIPDVHDGLSGRHLHGRNKTTILKTHWSFRTDLPLREDTVGAIYIVRNPIDVLESNKNFALMRSGELRKSGNPDALAKVADAWTEAFIANGGHPRFRAFGIGSWEEHVRSWTFPGIAYPRLLVRYEDLIAAPLEELARIARFLGVKRSGEQISRAVDVASKENMRAIEEREIAERVEGFFYQARNRSGYSAGHRFVGRSNTGESLYQLTDDQRARALDRFGPVMRELGYVQI